VDLGVSPHLYGHYHSSEHITGQRVDRARCAHSFLGYMYTVYIYCIYIYIYCIYIYIKDSLCIYLAFFHPTPQKNDFLFSLCECSQKRRRFERQSAVHIHQIYHTSNTTFKYRSRLLEMCEEYENPH